ncbi:MAG: DNA-primase RepB domain-containing protein, partial [Desulfoprunum sp.]|uniref:DNA-primase RepB domain-containing protein n=1 Tax=Desulfoprunum sp. TaxID=2020866 RepID=UPI003C71B04D
RNGGRKKADVDLYRAIWREADEPNLPALPIEPHLVVESSPGKEHEYILITPTEAGDFWDGVMAGMVEHYGSDPNAKDRSRVLRLPGFYHLKNRQAPHMVSITHESGMARMQIMTVARKIQPTVTTEPPPRQKTAEPKTTTKASSYGQKALEGELEKVRQATEGSRNATLNNSALSLGALVAGGELPEDLVISELTLAAEQVGLTPGEIRATIRSGLEAGKRQPRQAPPKDQDTRQEPPFPGDDDYQGPAGFSAGPEQADKGIDPAKIMEAFEVKEQYVKRLGKEKVLISNLLIMQHILVIIAMSGGGKTAFVFRHVAPELARQGLTVWYCDADSPASEHKVMKEIADSHGFRFINPDTNEGTDIDGLKAAISKIADLEADLSKWVFVFDTLKKFADLMQKNAVKQFFALCRRLTSKGASVILLAHANKYRDKDGNLIAEGVNDVRSDTDELIFFERTTNPSGGIDVTTIIDPDRGAKVRGLFESFSFHVSDGREISFYKTTLPTIDRTVTATPKATDDEIIEAARQYLFSRNEPVAQRQLTQHVSDMTGAGDKRVRQLIVQHSEPKDTLTRKGFPLVYTVGKKNAHCYEAAQ